MYCNTVLVMPAIDMSHCLPVLFQSHQLLTCHIVYLYCFSHVSYWHVTLSTCTVSVTSAIDMSHYLYCFRHISYWDVTQSTCTVSVTSAINMSHCLPVLFQSHQLLTCHTVYLYCFSHITEKTQWDHPQFTILIDDLSEYSSPPFFLYFSQYYINLMCVCVSFYYCI